MNYYFDKAINRLKQFGLASNLRAIPLYLLKPVLKINSNIVFAITIHKRSDLNTQVRHITYKQLDQFTLSNNLPQKELSRFKSFLDNDCKGYYIEDMGELAAWGFVQTTGKYQYAQYFYEIPKGCHVLKNLYVKPEFRGKSYGKLINEARINDIPTNYTPVGFVIPENRYAIRNLKIYGFEEYLIVRHISWFNRWQIRKIKILRKGEMSELLMEGFL